MRTLLAEREKNEHIPLFNQDCFGDCVSKGGASGQHLRFTTLSMIRTESADFSRILPKNDFGQSSKDGKGLHWANRELPEAFNVSKTILQC